MKAQSKNVFKVKTSAEAKKVAGGTCYRSGRWVVTTNRQGQIVSVEPYMDYR